MKDTANVLLPMFNHYTVELADDDSSSLVIVILVSRRCWLLAVVGRRYIR